MLSDMGYVGIAADFFGDGLDRWNSSFQDRINAVMAFRSDPSMYVSKLNAVIKAANELNFVDPEKLVVMGWCFGGTGEKYAICLWQRDVQKQLLYHKTGLALILLTYCKLFLDFSMQL